MIRLAQSDCCWIVMTDTYSETNPQQHTFSVYLDSELTTGEKALVLAVFLTDFL